SGREGVRLVSVNEHAHLEGGEAGMLTYRCFATWFDRTGVCGRLWRIGRTSRMPRCALT
ncbi:MAG: hypothetical protein QG554_957, partial [Pseudomonadota bacterium]|nr:hypothetical protein [Pseudomonadota bacterium]